MSIGSAMIAWSLAAALGAADMQADTDEANAASGPDPILGETPPPPDDEETLEEEDDPDAFDWDFRFAVRANLFHKSWATGSDRDGLSFDTVMLGLDATWEGFFTSTQYRFYDGYNMLHHGYLGYRFDDEAEIQVGVHQNPFGLLPYASHNYFFNLTYYVGLEDDYDLGAKFILDRQPFDLQLAYYARDEGNYVGESIDSARYSYDIVRTDASELGAAGVTTPRTNNERNQFNARLAYTIEHGDLGSTEIGGSAQWGQIHNGTTGGNGGHWAGAAHLNGHYDRFNVQLEAIRFSNNPKNPAGQDDRFIVRGAYDAPYKTASDGWLFVANLAYRLPLEPKPLDAITFYTDYSYLLKNERTYEDSQQFVVGASLEAGPALIYFDFAFGKNQPFLGPNYATALAEGDPNARWELRFNVNLGLYF